MGVRRLIGAVRQGSRQMLASESEAGDAHQSGEIRKAERRTTAEIATRLAEHLTAVASRKDEEAFPTASAARELCRDLGLQSSKQGPYLRIGMLLHSKESEGFLIKPHAPGLPSVTLGKRPQDHLIGSAVLYLTNRAGHGASRIRAVSVDAARRRKARVKLAGTAEPRPVTGPIRRIVSGGGPGTGKRA